MCTTISLKDYIEARKKEKETAERQYKQRKAIYDRAKNADEQAYFIKAALKEYRDKVKIMDDLAMDIDKSLQRAIDSGILINNRMECAIQSVILLSYETRDFLRQAETLINALSVFSGKAVLKDRTDILKSIDTIAKLLDTIVKNGLESLEKIFSLLKIMDEAQIVNNGNCGIIARNVELIKRLDDCVLVVKDPTFFDKFNAYPCTIEAADTLEDTLCDSAYNTYNNSISLNCLDSILDIKEKKGYPLYANNIRKGYDNATIKADNAREWLNCTINAKNEAETNFNACKAAYDLALTTYKC